MMAYLFHSIEAPKYFTSELYANEASPVSAYLIYWCALEVMSSVRITVMAKILPTLPSTKPIIRDFIDIKD